MITYSTHTLSNGLRIIHVPHNSPVAYCGFTINAGTRDEREEESGMAHFVEHLLFKGTTKRKAWHILNRMERVGGDLNAYTNKEETVIYSAFLKEHFVRAADLLTDILFRSTFPQGEIDKEVEVILDEIQSYEDSPSELIFDDFEELIFPNHPLGRNILGKPNALKGFTTADVKAFTQRCHCTENAVFFVQGDIPFKKIVHSLEKATIDIEFSQAQLLRQPPLIHPGEHRVIHKETNQAHVMLGNRGYDAHSDKRTALYLLNNLLGGPGMNSRLNVSLRERRGLVYNVEANLSSYTDSGLFAIYFGTDPSNVDQCLELVQKELKLLCDTPLRTSQLSAAQKQLIGQIGVASDNFENNALGIGKTFLHHGKLEERAELFKRIEALTPHKLWEVANEVFDMRQLSTLIYK
ncbi:MAG: M16 family metallopeptidase [Phocaeicola sp.]